MTLKTKILQFIILLIFASNILTVKYAFANEGAAKITGELKKWHKVTLTFDGPKASETD